MSFITDMVAPVVLLGHCCTEQWDLGQKEAISNPLLNPCVPSFWGQAGSSLHEAGLGKMIIMVTASLCLFSSGPGSYSMRGGGGGLERGLHWGKRGCSVHGAETDPEQAHLLALSLCLCLSCVCACMPVCVCVVFQESCLILPELLPSQLQSLLLLLFLASGLGDFLSKN